MIVDDAHALLAVLTAEANATGSTRQPLYLDARVPSTLHLRLLSALHKPTTGRLSRLLHGSEVDAGQRAALLAAVAEPAGRHCVFSTTGRLPGQSGRSRPNLV